MVPCKSVTFHGRHCDLMASCVLLLQSNDTNESCQHQMELLAQTYLAILTTRLCPNKLEAKALCQALNLCITVDSAPFQFGVTEDWVSRLADIGILHNCLALLNDAIKQNDLTQLSQTLLLLLTRVAHTHLGASRITQSQLLCTLETEFHIDETDPNAMAFTCQLLQLTVALLVQNGSMGLEFAFRFILAHWDKLNNIVIEGCTRINRPVNSAVDYDWIGSFLNVGQLLIDVLWHLLAVRGTWSLYWPVSLGNQLWQLVNVCTNTIAVILSQPQTLFPPNGAFIIHGKMRVMKQVSFAGQNTKWKSDHSSSQDDHAEQSMKQSKLELAASRLESILYKLLHSSLLLYSRLTAVISENCIYDGLDYNGVMLLEDFSESKLGKCDLPLSYGCIFSILGSTHCLLRDDIPPLLIDNRKILFNSDLIRQIHEIGLSTIVSHAIIYISKFDQSNKANKNVFVSNIRTELNYYLNEFAKTRRRNTLSSSSSNIPGPRITSTPYTKKSPGVTDNFDLFCSGLDQFKKALELM